VAAAALAARERLRRARRWEWRLLRLDVALAWWVLFAPHSMRLEQKEKIKEARTKGSQEKRRFAFLVFII
jgi:hypothetical protein